VLERLPSKLKALSSSPNIRGRQRERRREGEGKGKREGEREGRGEGDREEVDEILWALWGGAGLLQGGDSL
jgi:hypothetical protein